MNKIKFIELLNMISRGEEVPKKIKYKDDIYIHVDNHCSVCEETYEILSNNIYAEHNSLNDEIEIIEDTPKISKLYINNKLQYDLSPKEDKKIEKLKYTDTIYNSCDKKIFTDKINEIIDVINRGD